MNTDKRLNKRYLQLIQQHSVPAQITGAAHKPYDKKTVKAYTEALSRFLNNDNVRISALSQAMTQSIKTVSEQSVKRYLLVAQDWSKISIKHKNKHDTYAVSNKHNNIGYELQSSLLISDTTGLPIAPVAQNLHTAEQVYSSYDEHLSKQETHLDELSKRINWIKEQGFHSEKQQIINIIDREGDSFYHLSQWATQGHLFLVRIRQNTGLLHRDVQTNAQTLARTLPYRFFKDIDYKGQKAQLYVAQINVILKRKVYAKNQAAQKAEPVAVKLVCAKVVCNGQSIEPWYLLTNADITAEEATQFYSYRWQIESHFKLLKSSGHHIEDWQQESGEAFFKRLLIVAQSCLNVWHLMRDDSPETREYCLFLMRLSGKATRRQSPITAPALLLGYLKLLAAKELLDEMTPDEIRAAASQFTQKTKLCR